MRQFYRFMAKQIPFTWWKFFWLRLVQANLRKEIAASDKATKQPFGKRLRPL